MDEYGNLKFDQSRILYHQDTTSIVNSSMNPFTSLGVNKDSLENENQDFRDNINILDPASA